MSEDGVDERSLPVGETVGGESLELPTVEVLTGRGFVTGKSGGGKSNSVSVVLEELLDRQYPVMVVDTDGEYYGLKEEYELLHAGADEGCDIQVSPEHAERLATIALEENVPVILDVSGYLDEDEADELVFETARHLFAKEKKLKKPFLLVIEEVHEYIPEGAGMGETGRMLIKVGKRGRKHGLGVVGISQRPADVKKDFITQANWLVWHRLTWENDTKVVGRIVGSDYADEVADLDAGEAFVQADWTDTAVQRVQFKRKRTFDAGATPGLDDFERPELKSVSDALVDDLADITQGEQQREDRIDELERRLENREERIAELEDELDRARDVSAAARKLANAVAHGDANATAQATLADAAADDGAIDDLHARLDELEAQLERDADGDASDAAAAEADAGGDATAGAADGGTTAETATPSLAETLERLQESTERERAEREDAMGSAADEHALERVEGPSAERLRAPAVRKRLTAARAAVGCERAVATTVCERLVDGPARVGELAAAADASRDAVHGFLIELRGRGLVVTDGSRRYAFDASTLDELADG